MELSRIDFALMKVLQSRNCTAYFSGMTMQELISIVILKQLPLSPDVQTTIW